MGGEALRAVAASSFAALVACGADPSATRIAAQPSALAFAGAAANEFSAEHNAPGIELAERVDAIDLVCDGDVHVAMATRRPIREEAVRCARAGRTLEVSTVAREALAT